MSCNDRKAVQQFWYKTIKRSFTSSLHIKYQSFFCLYNDNFFLNNPYFLVYVYYVSDANTVDKLGKRISIAP